MSGTTDRTCLQIISTGGLYGAEKALLEISAYIREHGWDPLVIALEGRGGAALVERARSMGLDAVYFGANRVGAIEMVRRLSRIAAGRTPGIVHSHGYKPDVLLAVAPFARRWVRISTCHTWYSDTWQMRLWEWMDKRVLRGFDGVVPVSGFLEQELVDARVPRAVICRIDNGIEAADRQPDAAGRLRGELSLPPTARIILQIGRLARSKRNDLLLDALRHLPPELDAHVVFAGEGEERQTLEQMARSRELAGRVHFLGYRSDVLTLLSAADVLAITSDHEGLPIVLLEAMAARCPLVSTRVGAISDVLADGVTARLVDPGSASQLSAALASVLANPAGACILADAARREYEERYSRESMGRKYLALYEASWRKRAGLGREAAA